MASGTKLQLQFETATGSKTWTFNYAKTSAGIQNVKALGAAMIANGSIYEAPPLVLKTAKEVTTTENVYDLNA